MPQLDNVTTKASEEIWKSPDGSKVIHKVTLVGSTGDEIEVRTYSKDIAAVGWTGDVETYEQPGKGNFPSQTFAKQPQKQFGGRGGGFKGGSSREQDPFTMYLSYAKDLVVVLQETSGFDSKKFAELLKATVQGGRMLYNNRPGAGLAQDGVELSQEEIDKAVKLFE